MTTSTFRYYADALRHHAQQRPDKPAMVFGDRETSYAAFNDHANRVANGLTAAGIGHGDRVAVLALNSDRFFELWQGASRIGAVIVPVNFRLTPSEIAYVLQNSRARALFVGPEFVELAHQFASQLPLRLLVNLEGSGQSPAEVRDWPDWLARQDEADPAAERSAGDTVIQYYSSGTTGFPKGVECSHSGMLDHLPVFLRESGNWDDSEVSLVPMPLFHVAGSAFANGAFMVGATNVILPFVDPGSILKAIPAHSVTRTCLVPAVIHALLVHEDCPGTDFSSLRRVLYGASPMPETLARQATAVLGPCLEQTYGATETHGGFTLLSPSDHAEGRKLRSCGKPMSYVRVRVVDEEGRECSAGEVGEIVVQGGCLMSGYWDAPEATREAIRGGWYHTADMGYFDEDGYLYVHDRKHDMIITGAENVYPAEVENALIAHPRVAEAAVFGVPDEDWGEAVRAHVIAAPGEPPEPEELIRFCRERIAAYKCPREVTLVDELPRNPTGKVLKRELRAPFWDGQKRQVN